MVLNNRTQKAKKNIIVSGLFKGGDTLIYLLLVPLTLGYLNAYEYGIWLTLNSILTWINSFDIGLGNGLRNKLTEAIAKNDKTMARKYVSTTFVTLIFLAIVIIGIGSICYSFIDWYSILNVQINSVHNLDKIIWLSFMLFCLNFVLKFVGNVYQALQIPSAMYIFNFLGHLLSLVVIFILTKTTSGNLLLVAIIYSLSSPLIYLTAYPITFNILFKYLRPSFHYFDFGCVKELLNLSLTFFIMQVCSLVLFSMSNLIISHMFGPEEVTPYNIAQRYFSIITMVINIILAPIWSATTDAYIKKDYIWIKKVGRKLLSLLVSLIILIPVLVIISPLIYHIWIGNEVIIPLPISIFCSIYNFFFIWSLCYSVVLNGIGKLRIQIIYAIISAVLFVPICYFLGNLCGVVGVIIGMCIVTFPAAVLNTIQFNLIMSQKAHGIWNK